MQSANRLSAAVLAAFLCFLAISGISPAAADPAPEDVVEDFQTTLVSVMKQAENLGVKGRYEVLAKAIDRSFHARAIASLAVRAYWKDASGGQRDRLAKAFRHISASTLATLFDGYDGERFERLGVREGPSNTRVVDTVLHLSDGDTHDISYVMTTIEGRWWIIDAVIDRGISELNVRRSEYNRILQDAGIEGLIKALNDKADSLLHNG